MHRHIRLLVQATALLVAPPLTAQTSPSLRWGGSVDLYYLSGSGGERVVPLRGFDRTGGEVRLGLAELWAQRDRRPLGFRLDLGYGPTAELINSAEPSRSPTWRYVQQAYLSMSLSHDGRTYLDAGKYLTPAGGEMVKARDNWLHSRGLLFTWAVPVYHAGVRAYRYLNDTDYVMVHVNRGWNAVGDPGHAPGWGVTASHALSGRATLTANYLGGSEPRPGDGHAPIHLLDVAGGWTGEGWALALNADLAAQDDRRWHGASAQLRRSLHRAGHLTLRAEYLADPDGQLFGAPARIGSATVGHGLRIERHLETRVEYRVDRARGAAPGSPEAPRDQQTLTASIVLGL